MILSLLLISPIYCICSMYYFKKIYVLTGLIYVHIFSFVSCIHWYKSETMKVVIPVTRVSDVMGGRLNL